MKRIAEILGGGLEGYRGARVSACSAPCRAPLAVNGDLLDVTCEFARLGSPVFAYTMPMSGATGRHPRRDARADVGRVAGPRDRRPGRPRGPPTSPAAAPASSTCAPAPCRWAPENTILGVASVEIGHHLGLPVHNSGLSTDAKHPGLQAGYEKGLKVLPAALAGVDLISGGFGALAPRACGTCHGAHRRRDRQAR